MPEKVIVTEELWVFQSFFFIFGSNVTANVITSPSEDANELYAEIEEREYQEIPVRETYPEQQNENPLYESAAYETVPSIWQVWTICLSPYLVEKTRMGKREECVRLAWSFFFFFRSRAAWLPKVVRTNVFLCYVFYLSCPLNAVPSTCFRRELGETLSSIEYDAETLLVYGLSPQLNIVEGHTTPLIRLFSVFYRV